MRIKFNDIGEGSDTGAGVDGRKAKLNSAKITDANASAKKKSGGNLKVIEGGGIPGKADQT